MVVRRENRQQNPISQHAQSRPDFGLVGFGRRLDGRKKNIETPFLVDVVGVTNQ